MKKYTTMACVVAIGALALGGCSEDSPNGTSVGHGTLVASVALDNTVRSPRDSRAGESRADVPTAADLSLRLVSDDGSFSKEWATLSDFSTEEEFEVGSYTLEAWYGTKDAEGFDCPYYYGSCPVKIEDGKTTTVAMTAALSQALVDVTYTESFQHYMTDYSAKVQGYELTKDDTRSVYVTPGTVSVTVDFTKPNGDKGTNYEVAKFTAKAQTQYHVTVDLEGGAGDVSIVVTYDDEMDTQTVTIDISDLVMNAPAPVLAAVGFDEDTPIEFVSGMAPDDALQMTVIAQGDLKEMTLTTKSESLVAQGWPEEIELIAATSAQQSVLQSLGLVARGIFTNPDKAAVLDFSNVLKYITNTGDASNSFTLTVKDKNYKLSDPLTLSLTCETLVLEITGADTYQPGTPLDIAVAYNGSDMASNVTYSYRNLRNTWTTITDVTVGEAVSRATSDYTVTLGGLPSDYDSIELKATCGTQESNIFTAKTAPYNVVVKEYDVYAKHAYVTVEGTEDETRDQATLVAAAKYLISSDGGNTFTEATGTTSGVYTDITGLTAGTDYLIKVQIDGINSKTQSFTTETASQLPNAGMESWCQTDSGSNWALVYPATSESECKWGTNNPMTTSQGSDFAYCRISGTISDSEGASGNCAVLRTIGWGSGNTAAGNFSKIKYIDAGLLHLGSSRTARPDGSSSTAGVLTTDDLDCGLAFTSRPSSLSFKYKYENKNYADKGYVEYWVKDADGNVLASGSATLDAASSFTESKLDITYGGQGTAKAATIYVKFLSTYSTDYLQKSSDNLNYPTFGNLSDATSMGSKLYIDDITLTY